MTDKEQRTAAKKFAAYWKDKGYEKGQSQSFWLALLRDVFGVEYPEQFIQFEDTVRLDKTSFIDGIIPTTRVMIEQKSLGKDLKKPIKQSNGTLLTPFQQAKRYITELPLSQHPRWVVTCNFSMFHVYDMERPGGEAEEILLENLPTEYYRLSFLTDTGSEHLKREKEISLAAGEIVGLIYEAFAKQYVDPTSERTLKSLNVLCVRLVFCLYAEDAGIFGKKAMFRNYMADFETRHSRKALIDLFKILDTIPEDRDPYLDTALAAFPYVNGGLFDEDDIEIPQFTDEIKDLLLNKASTNFNWSEISPTIFGSVFESTLNPETRRSGGMHYTSIENIHKVIDPLFLDGLKKEFEEIYGIAVQKSKDIKLRNFQKKLASLSFLDPACGSGNFLTETYLSLRKLENKVLDILQRGQISLGDAINPILISIRQFYGIEINDFAVTVAKTALWIAESQMMKETETIVHMNLDFLPLKSYANIYEGNALRIDWERVVSKNEVSYIMGNPPFLGKEEQSKIQKADLVEIFNNQKGVSVLDYVSAWYKKAVQMIMGTSIRVAFVSTNSISQGEQPSILWETLADKVKIDFAYRTFNWNSEATEKAAVHCVIIGFSQRTTKCERLIYDKNGKVAATNINQYLLDAPTVFIKSRKQQLTNAPHMDFGNMPNDAKGLLSKYTDEQKNEIILKHPEMAKWFRPFLGAYEFINDTNRWCIWLKNSDPSETSKSLFLKDVVQKVREERQKSSRDATRLLAETPHLFGEIRQPDNTYILIPRHSSENRRYIPIGFVEPDVIAGDSSMIISNATLYHFGILTSNVHMAWTRVVCGRIKSDYRYSKDIVYNNFPWPKATDEQTDAIQKHAQNVLDARAKYPGSSLANMYGETSMLFHTELLKAHRELDKAVMKLYGFPIKDFTEADCVAALMELYLKLAGDSK